MPPRVAYWTSAFEADMEAVASEVGVLRRRFPGSIAWGLCHRNWVHVSPQKGCIFHPRLHWLFRMVTWCFESTFQLNHVFGSVGDWFYLQSEKRRPTVVTVATHSHPVNSVLLDRVSRFVVEYPAGKAILQNQGIDDGRIRLILPPVDLNRFVPRPAPSGPFTVLFASSPDKDSWLEARGVPQILDAARQRPKMRFRLLWRPWGDSRKRVAEWIANRGLHNVELVETRCLEMAEQYAAAHAVILPFTDPNRCKPAPNSLIEGLACGRPILTTRVVGLADLVEEGHAGLVAAPCGEAITEQLDRLAMDWPVYSQMARKLAEQLFGLERFVNAYRWLYQDVLTDRRR